MKNTLPVLLLRSIRPKQWTKNLIIFAPLLFSQNLRDQERILQSIFAFAVFCIVSGCVYILNDLIDLEQDKRHPIKSTRPLASGLLKPNIARIAFVVLLLAAGFISASFLNLQFSIATCIYLVLQIAYSTYLKHVVIIDVFCIAAGFVLRVIAGAEAIDVTFSTWLLFCTMLLSLFLALSKRRHELILLEGDAIHHRKILFEYSPSLLDHMISIVTTSTVIAYILYTISEDTVEKFGTDGLKYTVPFVLYGVFRYLYLIHQKNEGGSPEKVLLNDRPILFTVLLYGLTACLILYL
ncbi:decaprenyl-phosphate phosphoribosyltransferase [Thermodesulfobacteriota bacterium]